MRSLPPRTSLAHLVPHDRPVARLNAALEGRYAIEREEGNGLMSDPITLLNAALKGRRKIMRGLGEPGRLRWMLGVGAILALLVARPLLAADISGTWEISYQIGQGQAQTITLELVQKGSRVSGSGTMRADSIGDAIRVEVRSGTAGSRDFSFRLVEEGGSALSSQGSN